MNRALAAAILTLACANPASASDPLAPPPARQPFATAEQMNRFPGATGELALRILAAHNRERLAVGHPPLRWDAELAAAAAAYGPVLAGLHRLIHSPRETRPGQRENLAMAFHRSMAADQMVGLWSAEKRLLQPGLFPAVSRTGRWEDVAHYTQMVWPTTTRVGCALYEADWDYLICRYSPPGNLDGKPVLRTAALASR